MSTDIERDAPVAGPVSSHALAEHGLTPHRNVYWNLAPAALYEAALARGEGRIVDGGGFATVTVPHTGRSPGDKFTVREAATADAVDWGAVNVALPEPSFRALRADLVEHLEERDLFVRDARAGADPEYGIGVRLVTPSAWHSLFAYNMFLRPEPSELEGMRPDVTIFHDPDFQADPERHGTRSGAFIVVNLTAGEVLIGGTRYAGEIKKSVFSVLNFVLPDQGVLPMHCSANVGERGDAALFFGLSGTGKTTLSADPNRDLIGDDEHGWSERGVFNFEGGCYAKTIRLSPEGEPEIYGATQRFGAILENVVYDERTRRVDFDSAEITENTRASYPVEYVPNARVPGRAGHPENVIFLAADAFGVLPPVSRLSPVEAMYHFLSGYTAKVAGTERGVTEPKATFSACFGAPFLPRPPSVYAEMLGEKLRRHGSTVWLVNTGWTAGPHGVGHRIALRHTRSMVRAVLDGSLDDVETRPDPAFGLSVPVRVPDVPSKVLRPRGTWDDPDAYEAQAGRLAKMFRENFAEHGFDVSDAVREAGPA